VVNFNGANSTDPDGSVVAWDWSFSDGGTASGSSTSRTYSAAGSYVTTLKVTDNAGLSASSSVTITVDAPVAIVNMHVASIDMSRTVARNGSARATAAVKVVDAAGLPVAGASVSGRWSGLTSSTATLTTGTNHDARRVAMGLLLAFIARLITGAQGHWKGCPPKAEQRIYFANHQSHLDWVLIWAALPHELRATHAADRRARLLDGLAASSTGSRARSSTRST
jgi:hypothetical protein